MDLKQVWYLVHPHHGSNCLSGADTRPPIALGFEGACAHKLGCSETHVAAGGSKVSLCSSVSRALHLKLHSHLFVLELFYMNEKYSCTKRGFPSRVCNSEHKTMVRTWSEHSIPPDSATVRFHRGSYGLGWMQGFGGWLRQCML